MGNNKSPGNDDLYKEFDVCFVNKIHSCLLQALNMSFREGQLSSSQMQAVIVLIEKRDKDKRFLKNWRPVSLINVDAKIASKAIALRIKKVVGKLVQTSKVIVLRIKKENKFTVIKQFMHVIAILGNQFV